MADVCGYCPKNSFAHKQSMYCAICATQSAERDAAQLLDVASRQQAQTVAEIPPRGVFYATHARGPPVVYPMPSVCTIARSDFPGNFWQLTGSAHKETPQDLSHGAT